MTNGVAGASALVSGSLCSQASNAGLNSSRIRSKKKVERVLSAGIGLVLGLISSDSSYGWSCSRDAIEGRGLSVIELGLGLTIAASIAEAPSAQSHLEPSPRGGMILDESFRAGRGVADRSLEKARPNVA